MDATVLLTADHNRVRGLFKRFQDAHEQENMAMMVELADKIVTELEVHAEIEEQIFYPAIREASEDLAETVSEGVEEHHVAKVLISEIKQLPPDDEAWESKVIVLIESIEHHAGEEEEEMFPAVRKVIDAATREQMGEQMEALKAQLGAPTVADKEPLTTEELKELAREQEVPGRSKMNREELLATVAPA